MDAAARHQLLQSPELPERRIGKLQIAVTAKHRDAFGKVVECFRLDPQQCLEFAFKIAALGKILENPCQAALGVGMGHNAHRAPIRQVPPIFLRLQGLKLRKYLVFPALPFRHFRHLAVGAQLVEEHCHVGRGFEECRWQVPEFAQGLVEEFQPLVLVKHRNRGVQTVQRLFLGPDGLGQFAACIVDFGGVLGDGRGPGIVAHRDRIEQNPVAIDNGRQLPGKLAVGRNCVTHVAKCL